MRAMPSVGEPLPDLIAGPPLPLPRPLPAPMSKLLPACPACPPACLQTIGCGDSGMDVNHCMFWDPNVDFLTGVRTNAAGQRVGGREGGQGGCFRGARGAALGGRGAPSNIEYGLLEEAGRAADMGPGRTSTSPRRSSCTAWLDVAWRLGEEVRPEVSVCLFVCLFGAKQQQQPAR